MKRWRSSKHRRLSISQPSLPGLIIPVDAKHHHLNRRISTLGEQALDTARQRLLLAFFLFGVLFSVISGKLVSLTLFNETEPPVAHAASGETSSASRADIVDRNNTVLATSLPTISLCADTRKIFNAEETFVKLLTVLPELNPEKLGETLKGEKHCATIKRRLTPRQYYAVNKLGIAGLEFSPDEVRTYPAGNIMSHILGYTDIDDKGIAGLENGLNKRLNQNQEPVVLSIDLRIQTILHRELSLAMKEFDAEGAAGIIMDVSSGELLSLVSLPDFDPQKAGSADDNAKFNRATLGVYEMGSTFKIFNTAMAIDSGLIKVGDKFDTINKIEIGNKVIRDLHSSKQRLNVAEIFIESSNIGSARMAERMGAARQRAFLGRLGLMDKSTIELPENGQPIVPTASNWGDITTMTVAFGHGIAVSSIQLVSAVASILNDGILVHPTLLKRETPLPDNKDHIISSRTAAQMRGLMRLVVTNGTAKSAEVAGYLVGGKTGTADKISEKRYSENARLSSFIGVFPANSPRYVVFALLDNPKGNAKTHGYATGGWTAAPIVGKVISQIGPLLNMQPLEPDIIAATEHQLLRPLGGEVLNNLQSNKETDNYASVESNNAR